MRSRSMTVFLGAAGVMLLAVAGLPDKGEGSSAAYSDLLVPVPSAPVHVDLTRVAGLDAADLRERLEALDWGRNPFAAPRREVLPVVQPADLPTDTRIELPQLFGVGRSAHGDLAILDEEVLAAGERTVDGFLVQSIRAGQVTLLLEGRQHVLSIAGNP